MQLLGNREVVAIVVTGRDAFQVLASVAFGCSLCADRLSTAQRQVAHSSRPRLFAAELRHRGGELSV
jgi:hypothetical protein